MAWRDTPRRSWRRPAALLAGASLAFAASVAAAQAAPPAANPSVLQAGLQAGLPAALPAAPLPPAVRQALAQAGVGTEDFAAVALPIDHGRPAWGHRAWTPMQPASTMKLLTSIVALHRLGPNRRGGTDLVSAAPLVDGVLAGDLVLRGGADPDLGIAQLWQMLMELRAAGVRRIAGDVLLDRTLFEPARSDVGTAPFDDAPEWPYNVIPDALHLAGSLLPIELHERDGRVVAQSLPALAGVEIDASGMVPDDRPCVRWEEGWQPPQTQPAAGAAGGWRIELRGRFPRGCTRRAALQLLDRDALAQALVGTLWSQLGGVLDGRVRAGAAPADARVLVARQSRPWGEVLRSMNKDSDNPITRLLFLTLGVAPAPGEAQVSSASAPSAAAGRGDGAGTGRTGLPASASGALPATATATATAHRAGQAVRDWLAANGVAAPGLVLDNGSGLSRSERVAPATLAEALRLAWIGPLGPELAMSLPVAGVDGTMRRRLRDSPAAGWARLKSGTLRDVAALAGYVRDADGRLWAVAMMVNHRRAARARPALDAMVDAIARHGVPVAWRPRWVDVGPQGEGP